MRTLTYRLCLLLTWTQDSVIPVFCSTLLIFTQLLLVLKSWVIMPIGKFLINSLLPILIKSSLNKTFKIWKMFETLVKSLLGFLFSIINKLFLITVFFQNSIQLHYKLFEVSKNIFFSSEGGNKPSIRLPPPVGPCYQIS